MELLIALAAEDQSLMISRKVRSILDKSYSSLFANVYYRVYELTDRTHSEVARVKNMSEFSVPVLVTIEDQNHKKLTVVADIPTSAVGINKTTDEAMMYFSCGEKSEEFKLERRVIQIRGIEYAIASTIARRAGNYIDFAR